MVHLIVVVRESDVYTRAAPVAILVEEDELRILVLPHGEPDSWPTASFVVRSLQLCKELDVGVDIVALQVEETTSGSYGAE